MGMMAPSMCLAQGSLATFVLAGPPSGANSFNWGRETRVKCSRFTCCIF